jgi:hypothetical protein
MSGVATAVVGTAIVGGYLQGEAAKDAAAAQGDASNRASAQSYWATQAAKRNYEPYVAAGSTALSDMAANRNYFQNQFGAADLNSALAPGYDFRLKQGQSANLQASNATGGMVGGNALKSLQDYTQNFASGEYANAFNQYQAQRSNIYNQLSDIAKLGFSGSQGQANAELGLGNNLASLTMGAGNAQAASNIAQGNAWANTAQTIGNVGAYYGMGGGGGGGNAGAGAYNDRYTSYNANASGGGSFAPTSGNSFSLKT